jgi:hypothetical protein
MKFILVFEIALSSLFTIARLHAEGVIGFAGQEYQLILK